MIRLAAGQYDLLPLVYGLGLALIVGIVSGGLHSLLLWRSMQVFIQGGSVLHAVILRIGRSILAAAALTWTCRSGAPTIALLPVAFAAFIAGRNAVLRRVGALT